MKIIEVLDDLATPLERSRFSHFSREGNQVTMEDWYADQQGRRHGIFTGGMDQGWC